MIGEQENPPAMSGLETRLSGVLCLRIHVQSILQFFHSAKPPGNTLHARKLLLQLYSQSRNGWTN
jgi:hypothetical protein